MLSVNLVKIKLGLQIIYTFGKYSKENTENCLLPI